MPSSSPSTNNAVVAIMAAMAFAAGTLSGVILMKIRHDQKAKKARQHGMHSVRFRFFAFVDLLLFYRLLMSALLFLFLLLLMLLVNTATTSWCGAGRSRLVAFLWRRESLDDHS
jgi:hypothetical protein